MNVEYKKDDTIPAKLNTVPYEDKYNCRSINLISPLSLFKLKQLFYIFILFFSTFLYIDDETFELEKHVKE